MLSNLKTEKFSVEQFVEELTCDSVCEKDLLDTGFKKNNGYYFYVKNKRRIDAIIALESKESQINLFAKALAVKKFLQNAHIFSIGILVCYDTIEQDDKTLLDTDVLFLHFTLNNSQNLLPYDNVYCGYCAFTVSPYPELKNDALKKLKEIVELVFCNCKISNDTILGEYYFATSEELEQKMIDFAKISEQFDADNKVISRVKVDKLTLPVKNNEYYSDLFSFVNRISGKIKYTGNGGTALSQANGVFIDVSVKNKKNLENLYEYLKIFTEDIYG